MLTILFASALFVDNFNINWAQPVDYVIDLSHYGPRLFGKPISSNGSLLVNESVNPEEQGSYLEGDLLHPSTAKNGMKAEAYRWKDGVVPFEIKGSYCESFVQS